MTFPGPFWWPYLGCLSSRLQSFSSNLLSIEPSRQRAGQLPLAFPMISSPRRYSKHTCFHQMLFLTVAGLFWLNVNAGAQERTPRFRAIVLAEHGGIHRPFVDAAKKWLGKLASENDFALDYIEDTETINDEFLAKYKLFIQLNYPPYNWTDTAKTAFIKYIEEAKGAGSDFTTPRSWATWTRPRLLGSSRAHGTALRPCQRLVNPKLQIAETGLKSRTLGRCTHDSHTHLCPRHKIALAHRREVLTVDRTQRLNRIFFSDHSPPDCRCFGEIGHSRPIREVPREDDTRVTPTVEEFCSTLHPVLRIDTHHQSRLVVQGRILTVDPSLKRNRWRATITPLCVC
jgi:hypothetical protein